jgi:oxaloacetate decarboxylase (Na+ extruding) subunit alpha
LRHEKGRIPLRVTDTTLRDAHQSLWATRMRMSDILGIIDVIDSAGYYSLEVWGGATFDVCLRFLRENPWERLRQIKAKATKTPLQMLLRGQNVVGYKNYPDDVLDHFVALACENGIDIFRIFDALNDTRNLEFAIKSVKKHGGHAQGVLCYTISPVHTVDKYVKIAREQVQMGIDSLCIKDMAGFLSPISAEKLISALVEEVNVPVQMHCHATSGMATATYVEGVRAGAGAIDCAISPMAGFSSLPPVETMISIFEETSYHANLDPEALRKICKYFQDLAPERNLGHQPPNVIDPEVLLHHIPGGMISNLRFQLEQQGALDKLDDVLKELPRVREDFGYPPLVTPTSQIVGVQAVMNVLAGERYAMVPEETKNYMRGFYGRAPSHINPEIRKKILDKERPITCRPADLIEPMLPQATNNVEADLIKGEEDIISYCLFPEIALDYFKWRKLPADQRPKTPAEVEYEQKKAVVPNEELAPPTKRLMESHDYREIHSLIEKIKELDFSEVVIRRHDVNLSLRSTGSGGKGTVTKEAKPHEQAKQKPITVSVSSDGTGAAATAATPAQSAAAAPAADDKGGVPSGCVTIDSPLSGTFYLTEGPGKPQLVKEGDDVKADALVCIVEAMKLFNQIKSPFDCRIVKCLVEHGKPVQKGMPLIAVEKK